MAAFTHRSSGTAAVNAGSTHTLTFTPAAANSLLVLVAASGTLLTFPAGWTEKISAINYTGLYVATKTATAGETSVVITHNAAGYVAQWAVYEFPPGSAYGIGTQANGQTITVPPPALTGIPSGHTVFAVLDMAANNVNTLNFTSAWTQPPTEDVDAFAAMGTNDGNYLTIAYVDKVTGGTVTPAVTVTKTGSGSNIGERITFSILPGAVAPPTVTASSAMNAPGRLTAGPTVTPGPVTYAGAVVFGAAGNLGVVSTGRVTMAGAALRGPAQLVAGGTATAGPVTYSAAALLGAAGDLAVGGTPVGAAAGAALSAPAGLVGTAVGGRPVAAALAAPGGLSSAGTVTAGPVTYSAAVTFGGAGQLDATATRNAPATTTVSLWTTSTVPASPVTGTGAYTNGLHFTTSVAGSVTGVRFYKPVEDTGTHIGTLWGPTGVSLATVTFAGETASGWQTATFPAPVIIATGQDYAVSVYSPVASLYGDNGYPWPYVNPPLTGTMGGYAAGNAYPPANTAANTWADVLLQTEAAPAGTASAALNGPGLLTAGATVTAGPVTYAGAASFVAVGDLAVGGTGRATAAGADLAGPGQLAAFATTATGPVTYPAAAVLGAPGSLTVSAGRTTTAAAALGAPGRLDVTGGRTAGVGAALAAPGRLDALVGVEGHGAAAMRGPGRLSAGASRQTFGGADLTGPGQLQVNAVRLLTGLVAMSAPGQLSASQGPLVSGWLAGTAVLLAHVGTATLLHAAGVAVLAGNGQGAAVLLGALGTAVLAGDGVGTARLHPSVADAVVAR